MAGPIQLSSSLRTEVHVWTVELEASSSTLEQFFSILSEDERARAERFAFQDLRESFVICRGVLRNLVGTYLSLAPQDVMFATQINGKPYVEFGDGSFQFNLSHSGNLAVYAFSIGCELGIDIEQVVHLPDMEDLARSLFCVEEYAEMENLPQGSRRTQAFFSCWTRKEAFIKAKGAGLTLPLDSFRVSVQPNEAARLIHISGDSSEAARWSLSQLHPRAGCVGALALPQPRRVRNLPHSTAEQIATRVDELKRSSNTLGVLE